MSCGIYAAVFTIEKYPSVQDLIFYRTLLTVDAHISLNGVNYTDNLFYTCDEVTFASEKRTPTSNGEKSIPKAGPHIIAVTYIKAMPVVQQEKTTYAFCSFKDLA